MSLGRALVPALLIAAALPARAAEPAPADAARTEARQRFDRGLRLFEEGDNAGALAEFRRAHELVPNKLVLFNIGMVYAAMNRPVESAEALDRVLADPGPLSADRLARARATRDEQAQRIARLTIKTNVPAAIEVDGVEVGKTPLAAALRVSSGSHVVGALAAGHLPSRRETSVAGGASAEIAFELQPTESRLGQIDLRSPLPGAEVLVDGAVTGKTPLAASLAVPPGAHTVELRRRGYLTAKGELALGEGAHGELTLNPEEDPATPLADKGYLTLAISEDEAQVAIDGRPRGVYRQRFLLPAGGHHVRIDRGGFDPLEREVIVPPGAEATVRVTLRPTPETRLAYVSRTRSRARLGWGATIGGALVAGAAGGLALWSHSDLPDAEKQLAAIVNERKLMSGGECDTSKAFDAEREARCQARQEDAAARVDNRRLMRTLGIVGAGVGVAAVATGVYLLVTGEDSGKYDHPSGETIAGRAWVPLAWVDGRGANVGVRASF
jgi:hypothetical protein